MTELTNQTVRALQLPEGVEDKIFFDDDVPGFGIRLRRSHRSWIIQYRFNGKQRRESLGDPRKISVEDARRIARQRFAQVELGTDPAAARAKARAQGLTLGVVIPRYLNAKRERLRSSTFKAAERYFAIHWKPLHNRPIEGDGKVTRADVAGRLQELIKAHGRTAAARARNNLSALYGWSMREGLCESNPVLATNDPAEGIPARDRVLNDDEVATVWRACGQGDDDAGRIIKLLLLTGCRREEIGGLRWTEVNLTTGLLTIPGTRTKNGRSLELLLPPAAIDLLSVPREGREFVFGRFDNGFGGWSAAKWRIDAQIVVMTGKPIAAWIFHDLRRTVRTNLGKLGVPPHVAELTINHVKGGIEAIYDRHKYQREIGDALERWADYVQEIVTGKPAEKKKIVRLR